MKGLKAQKRLARRRQAFDGGKLASGSPANGYKRPGSSKKPCPRGKR